MRFISVFNNYVESNILANLKLNSEMLWLEKSEYSIVCNNLVT